MNIAEIYPSIQGEGFFSGTASVFVRASGCNLRCWFCDTPYASWSPEGEDLSIDEIASRVLTYPQEHVVLTGGEPMLFSELVPLSARLRRAGRVVTIETAGTLDLPVSCDLMSISPKLANSTPSVEQAGGWSARHDRAREAPEVIRALIGRYDYQFKFVVDRPSDVEEVEAWLADFPEIDRQKVMLMPQGISREELAKHAEWLEPLCEKLGLRFCPRRQIEWFGLTRGT